MASQNDARMFAELCERVEKIETLLSRIADEVQRIAMGDTGDLMPMMYPEGREPPKDAA